jgi:zinc protease
VKNRQSVRWLLTPFRYIGTAHDANNCARSDGQDMPWPQLGAPVLPAIILASMTAHAIDIPHDEFQLDNGLNVILHHDDSLPQIVVNLWYGVGSKDEEPGRSGFAHLFEHLMFMGTVHLPGSGFDERMEAHGGWNNAWTSEDATDYYEAGPSNLLETFIWMESDRMRGLAEAMTQEKLDLQRDVVRNERRQSVEDTPYGIIWEAMSPALYPAEHPYGHTVIGTHEDLQAATVDDVVRFFGSWYAPNNASLVIAGDFEPAQARTWVQQYFGSIPRVELPERTKPEALIKPQQAEVETTDNVQIPLTMLTWHTPAAFQKGDAAFDVVASILGEGRSSRLYQDLVTASGDALEVGSWQYSQMLGSIFAVTGKPSTDVTLEDLEIKLQAHIDRLAKDGPTELELERVRNQLEVSFISDLEGLQQRASALNRYRYLSGTPDFVNQDLERYRKLTAKDVQSAAATLTAERRCILRVRPSTGGDQ